MTAASPTHVQSVTARRAFFRTDLLALNTHSDALALKCSGCVMLQVSCEPPSEPAVASMSFGYYYPISLLSFKKVWLTLWNAPHDRRAERFGNFSYISKTRTTVGCTQRYSTLTPRTRALCLSMRRRATCDDGALGHSGRD
jgi:hypothetical protein